MDSFLSWVGGKRQLRKTICEQFPENFNRYVEPFGGAGWVLFYKTRHASEEVYNDINGQLVNLFRCVKHHPEAIRKELEFALNSREIFSWLRGVKTDGVTDIQRAARYLYLIKTSYGSEGKHFGPKSRNMNKLCDISDASRRLNAVVIENLSFDVLIDRYDAHDALFYCDPPYFGAERFYDTGDFVFDESQHAALRDILAGIKGRFILSYNDCPFVRGLYAGFKIDGVSRQNNLDRYGMKKSYRELIIRNYELPDA